MSNPQVGPFKPEDVIGFFEKMTGKQFVDAATQRPVLELIQETKMRKAAAKQSDYEHWLEEQNEDVKLSHQMEAL